MAFAAVVSVEQILQQLILNPADAVPKSAMESFHVKIRSLQSYLEKMYPVRRSKRDVVKRLESEIRETVYEAQDLIEAFISSHNSQPDFLVNLKENEGKLDQILATAEEIVGSVKDEQPTPPANAETSKSISRATKNTKIVGQEEDFKTLSKVILSKTTDLQVIPITGLPGIGKTTLARSIFDDKEIGERFPVRSWVTVGQDFNPGEVFSKLLASIQKGDGSVKQGNAEHLATQLYKSLQDPNKPYLIVVDDVWDSVVWDRIRNYFPNRYNCSRILVTTRSYTIAGNVKSGFSHTMKELNEEQSWELLREKVFGGGHCPPNLEVAGRSIAEHCGGLPLSITVVGGQLSQEIENESYWKIVEEDIKIAADSDKETAYMEILAQSYEHLPAKLKGCFLYMGAFPEDSEIHVSKLVKLWLAEGFLMENGSSSFEDIAEQCLADLLDRNLVFPLKFSSNGKVKTCGMHDSIRHLAESKSVDERFFVSVKKVSSQRSQLHHGEAVADTLKGKHTQSQRRLSVHKNILMCMEDVYESAKLIKPARTLVYAGHYHHHPLPYCLVYDWLRVLDAVRVHFIEFPTQLVKLIHLRYLSLTYNGKLPASLSQLTNLLVLIVRRYPKIVIMGKSILPVEIWYMKQLRHILLTECDFPNLPETQTGDSPLLENLQTLSAINAANCTQEFFKNVPNLKKLGVWIEAPGTVSLYLDHLQDLEAFKFRVLNPIPGKEIYLERDLVFPEKLEKLSLSGCSLPWDSLNNVGKFPCLRVLKLRHFAFQGPEWIPVEEQFPKLELLLIECLDLEYMEIGFASCENLKSLIIKNCYKLEEINEDEFTNIGTLVSVELIGCNHQFVDQLTEIKNRLDEDGKKLEFGVHSSWGETTSPNEC
ncbi:putative late blight resistance protein homolog R1A-3 [Salvia splendens]|uniref:putative late blight resistance protein homolog R1A-3 n=1 Tax=Salvia splendens TaxID=180675 RepID=UPI001C278941|nr:putative late blight resistance protein homolog R1A-3 [Salvia splendens]XP_042039374.1 putative late blight resistance protein homolog R1A-3 [Salvia splendens]